MNKFLTKFKQIVDKCDRIVIEYWDCIGSDRSSRDSGSANNSHYLNLTHSLSVWVPPKSMLHCFKHNQINGAKVNPIRTRSQCSLQQASLLQTQSNQKCKGEPDTNPIAVFFATGFLASNTIKKSAKAHPIRTRSQGSFLLCGKYRLWYFRNHDKSPLQSGTHECAPCAHRNLRFRAAHFSPLFQHHTISTPDSCRKTLFVTAFIKNTISSIFPLNW